MARLENRTLHQSRSQSQLGEVEGKSDDYEGGADHAKIGRGQKAGEKDQYGHLEHGDGGTSPRHPRHAADRAVRQV